MGGTGNPYFTTDTTAVLRALELECDVLLKGTKVDGVYDKDPEKYSKAKKFSKLDYNYVINNNLKIMDMTSIIMAEEASLPIIVFSIKKRDELKKVIEKKQNLQLYLIEVSKWQMNLIYKISRGEWTVP